MTTLPNEIHAVAYLRDKQTNEMLTIPAEFSFVKQGDYDYVNRDAIALQCTTDDSGLGAIVVIEYGFPEGAFATFTIQGCWLPVVFINTARMPTQESGR